MEPLPLLLHLLYQMTQISYYYDHSLKMMKKLLFVPAHRVGRIYM